MSKTTEGQGATEISSQPEYSVDSAIPKDRREGRFLLLALGVFIALAFATNYPVLRGRVPIAREVITQFPPWSGVSYPTTTPHAEVGDSVTIFYPWRVFQRDALRARELPLWNPYILAGEPFLAEPQSALFYPFHLLLLLMYPVTFWTFKLLLNLTLSGFFTALFLRSIGASRSGAVAAGIIFSFCGFMAAWQSFSALADVAIWLPFILWTVHRLCSKPGFGPVVLAAFAFAMPVLAGHPETAVHVILMGSAFALWECVAIGWQNRSAVRLLLWFTAAGLLSAGLAAVQWIPLLEWVPLIPHSLSLHWGPLPTRGLAAFFSRDLVANPNSAGLPVPESAAYLAPIALLLAAVSWFGRNRGHVLFFAAVTVLATFTVYGWWPVAAVVNHIPVLEGVKNHHMILLVDFSLAALAGFGLTALETDISKNAVSRKRIWVALGVAAVAALAGISLLAHLTTSAVPVLRSPASTAVFLFLGFALLAARVAGVVDARLFASLVLVILCVDLLTFHSHILPFARRGEIFPKAPVFDFLKAHADPYRFRVSSLDDAYLDNAEMVYGLAAANGYDITLLRLKNFLNDFSTPAQDTVSLLSKAVAATNDRRMDLLNVKYFVVTPGNESFANLNNRPDRFKLVFSEGSMRVFENLHALPRSFFVPSTAGSIEVQPDDKKQLLRVKEPSFDPEKTVILPSLPASLARVPEQSSVPVSNARISIVSGHPNGMDLAVENAQPGVLVVSQTFYPGWVAVVDGKETPVVPADYLLDGIPLGAGTHAIQLEFRPATFRSGLVVSFLSCLIAAGLLVKGIKLPVQ